MTLLETEWEAPKATVSTGEAEGDMTRRDIPAVCSVKGRAPRVTAQGSLTGKRDLLCCTHKLNSGELQNFQKNLSSPTQLFHWKLYTVETLSLPTLRSISLLLSSQGAWAGHEEGLV